LGWRYSTDSAWKTLINAGGREAEQKRTKIKRFFGYPAPKKKLGHMAQTPWAGTGDSVGWYRCYHCSTLINYNSNLSMCGTFLDQLLPPRDNHELLSIPKETYDLNLGAVTPRIWSFRTPTSIFVPKNCTILVGFHPLVAGWFCMVEI